MTYKTVNDIFISKFPELAPLIEEQFNLLGHENISPYILLPYVLAYQKTCQSVIETLRKIVWSTAS